MSTTNAVHTPDPFANMCELCQSKNNKSEIECDLNVLSVFIDFGYYGTMLGSQGSDWASRSIKQPIRREVITQGDAVSYTHLDVYKRQCLNLRLLSFAKKKKFPLIKKTVAGKLPLSLNRSSPKTIGLENSTI